jgi:hypothetical protein
MFEYFADNYVWNLAVNIALATGGQIGEIDEVCRPLQAISTVPGDAGTVEFFKSWCAMAERLVKQAEIDLRDGHELSAAARFRRASVYFSTAERMQNRHYAPRWSAYRSALDAFAKAMTHGYENCERVGIPYQGEQLFALYVRAHSLVEPAPLIVAYNGLDSTKEMIYCTGMAQELARRGVSCLIVDHPGSGEALRLHGLTGTTASAGRVRSSTTWIRDRRWIAAG